MFKCNNCGKSSKDHKKVVVEKRKKIYEGYPSRHDPNQTAHGTEIAKELNLCPECVNKLGNKGKE